MIELNLVTNSEEQKIIKQYLEENASEILADKINNGVKIVKDDKTLINKKTLDGFMSFATEEAKKAADKGARSACIRSDVVFGWAIHYFEEDSIEGTLYNEDGSPYAKPVPKAKTVTAPTKAVVAPKKEQSTQMSLFDFGSSEETTTEAEETVQTDLLEDEPFEVITSTIPTEDEDEKEEELEEAPVEKKPTLYDKYLHYQDEYPTAIIAMRVGDFYEVFGDAAIDVSERLELTLTSRDFGLKERVKMVGFPYHRIDVYREKIRDFASVAFIENDEDIKIYFRKDSDTPNMVVDTKTGEVIEQKHSPAVDDLIGILFGIMKHDLEDRR